MLRMEKVGEGVEEEQLVGESEGDREAESTSRLMEWDLDDAVSEAGKSTCSSSYPFGSPNPSDVDEHGAADARRRRRLPADGSAQRPPMSERQQLALLKQITAPDQRIESPRSPTQTPTSASRSRGRVARVHRRNERGETPLHTAARRGEHRQCKKLLMEGADVNSVDYAGWTPLHEACNHGWYKVAKVLLSYGANVNARGLDDDTPLHDAVSSGNKKLISLLLRHNANRDSVNKSGHRPIDTADDDDLKQLLLLEKEDSPSPQISSGSGTSDLSDHDLSAPSPKHPSTPTEKPFSECDAPSFEFRPVVRNGASKIDDDCLSEKDEREIVDTDSGNGERVENERNSSPFAISQIHSETTAEKSVTSDIVLRVCEESREQDKESLLTESKSEDRETAFTESSCELTESEISPDKEKESAESKISRTPLTKRCSGIRSPRLLTMHSATAVAAKSLKRRGMMFRKRHQFSVQKSEGVIKKRKIELRGRKRSKICESPAPGRDIYDFHTSDSEEEEEKREPGRLFHCRMRNSCLGGYEVEKREVDKYPQVAENAGSAGKPLTKKDRLFGQLAMEQAVLGAPGSPKSPPKVPPLRIIFPSTSRSASDDEVCGEAHVGSAGLRSQNQPYVFRPEVDGDEGGSECGSGVTGRGKTGTLAQGNGGSGNSSQEGETTQRLTRSQVRAQGIQLETATPSLPARQDDAYSGNGIFPLNTNSARGLKKPWMARSQGKLIEPTASIEAVLRSQWSTPESAQTISIMKKNSYEAYKDLRKIIEGQRKRNSGSYEKDYSPPENYKNFLLNKKTYLLQKSMNNCQQQLNAPQTLMEPMLSLFKKQESARQSLRHQHRVERERLILCCEKEVLRLHVRDTRISFLSAARVLRDTEVYNPLELEKASLSHCETASVSVEEALESLKLQFGKKKAQLINRQRMEAQSLQAAQQMTWEAQLKKATQILKTNATSVPSVQILEDFDLLPNN